MVFYDKEFIAKKIRLARKNAKLTQEELAEKIEISAKQLSRIEMATYIPSVPTFLKIINELKIDLKDFGIENFESKNLMREKFLRLIYSLNDSELEFYYDVFNIMNEKSILLKK